MSGTVHSSFSRAANLLIEPDVLLGLSARNAPRSPNGVVVDFRNPPGSFLDLQPGEPVFIGDGCIHIPSLRLTVETAAAPTWDPRPALPSGPFDPARLQESVGCLASFLAQEARFRGGLGPVLAHLLSPLAVQSQLPSGFTTVGTPPVRSPRETSRGTTYPQSHHLPLPSPGAFARRALPAVRGLLTSIRSRDVPGISYSARTLAGLGPGLTPSGDDFLIGVCAALFLGRHIHGRHDSFWDLAAGSISRAALGRTTLLSATWLGHASRYQFGAELGALLVSLTSGNSGAIEPAAAALLGAGASSGLDSALGLLLGLIPALSPIPVVHPQCRHPLGNRR